MSRDLTDEDRIAWAIWSAAQKSLALLTPIEDTTPAKLNASVELLKAIRISLNEAGFKIVPLERQQMPKGVRGES